MFTQTQSHPLGRRMHNAPHHRGRAALRHALVLALLALTLFTGPQPAHAVATASNTPGTVVAWGSNIIGETTVPGDLSDVIAIAAGGYQNLALKSDGTVVAWGNNDRGQGNIPAGLTDVTAIAAGNGHNLALKGDGTVVAWGKNNNGQATVPAGLTDVTAIAAGNSHSLVLKGDGTVVAWGNNGFPAEDGRVTVPTGLDNVIAIAAGDAHSLALQDDGTVVAWGTNDSGISTVPAELTDVTAIAAGLAHSLALKADGTVVTWGSNIAGQATVPAGLTNVIAIAAGGFHSLALQADGTVVAWGNNNFGQRTIPTGLSNVSAIAAGDYHSVALIGAATAPEIDVTGNGVSIVSGDNSPDTADHTNFGGADVDGGTIVRTFTIQNSGDAELSGIAVSVESGLRAAAQAGAMLPFSVTSAPATTVAAGESTEFQITFDPSEAGASSAVVIIESNDADEGLYTFAVQGNGTVRISGTVVSWGVDIEEIPAGLNDVMAIAGGSLHSLALKGDGTVVVWGDNSTSQKNVPAGLANVVAIAAGNNHSLALKDDGTVVTWGATTSGVTTLPTGLAGVVAVAGGGYHSLALKDDGTVVGWGDNNFGQTDIPAGLDHVMAIAGGGSHNLALRDDGTVVAWGRNNVGQATVPETLTDVVAIAAGGNHSLALKSDGTVVAWGQNNSGQSTVPTGLGNVVAIAGGDAHSLALQDDGTVVAWGSNSYGQTTIPADLAGVLAISGGDLNSLAIVPFVAAPEIDVTGNGVSIVNRDDTPDTADHTNFGSAEINGGTVVRTFTIENSGDAELSGIAVSVESGLRAAASSGGTLPFSVTSAPATTVAAGESTEFQITFAPSTAEGSTAVVIIASNDADENPYVFRIGGIASERLLPNTHLAAAGAATQSCAAGSDGYVYDCTVTFTLNNAASDLIFVGHYRVNSISAHAYVLNGEPTPGQAGTIVQTEEFVFPGETFQPEFVVGLTTATRYTIRYSVFGMANVPLARTNIATAELVEIGTFDVTFEPGEEGQSFQLYLPTVVNQ